MTISEPTPPASASPKGVPPAHVSTRFAVIALWSLVCAVGVGALTLHSGVPGAAAVLAALAVLGGAFFGLEKVIQ